MYNMLSHAFNNLPPWVKNLPTFMQAGGVAAGVGGLGGWLPTRSFAMAGAAGAASGLTAGIGVGLGQAYFGAMNAVGYGGFKTPGHLMNFGFEPHSVLGAAEGEWAGASRFKGFGGYIDYKSGSGGGFRWGGMTPEAAGTKFLSAKGLAARAPGNAIGLGMNAFFMYQGYKEGGLGGAYDAMAVNASTEAALYHWGYGVGPAGQTGKGMLNSATKLAGHPLRISTSTALLRGMGAGVGGYIGQQIGLATGIPMAGTLGAAAGAYVGGAPLQAMRASPILVGGMMAGVAAGAIGYGAYSVVKTAGKMGFAHRQSMRGINTDGDMSAFMTQNAVTMRERSVQAIAKSHLNARSALGQEANFMHSPRNYNSRYR